MAPSHLAADMTLAVNMIAVFAGYGFAIIGVQRAKERLTGVTQMSSKRHLTPLRPYSTKY